MRLPKMQSLSRERRILSAFAGYHHAEHISDGEFYRMKNLTGCHYPVFAVRDGRRVSTLEGCCTGMAGAGSDLYYILNGLLKRMDYQTGLTETKMTGLTTLLESSIVRMGNYLCVFSLEDKQVIKIEDIPSVQQNIDVSAVGTIQVQPCTLDGSQINPVVRETAPTAPTDGSYWMDISSDLHTLKQWSKSEGVWHAVPTSYVKLIQTGIGEKFNRFDGIRVWAATDLGGLLSKDGDGSGHSSYFVVEDKSDDALIVAGLCDQAVISGVSANVSRSSPHMEYVVECGNRLWGCSNDGKEIYASKLGDPFNWNCYMGISTDSYAATIGAPGKFTGAIAYAGTVYFFKSDCMIKVQGTEPSNFRVNEIPCDGVQNGSNHSLCVAEGMLFYQSRIGVMRYDGSLPVKISDDLGTTYYHDAVGGAADGRYYISMIDAQNQAHLFVYDIQRNMWHREDGACIKHCAQVGNELYGIGDDESGTQQMFALNYHPERHPNDSKLLLEKNVVFLAETGDRGLESPDRKYIGQIQLRCMLAAGGNLCLDIQYDSDGEWNRVADITVTSKRTLTLPITLRRCDHYRLRFSGHGECRIYSITETIEAGGRT